MANVYLLSFEIFHIFNVSPEVANISFSVVTYDKLSLINNLLYLWNPH